MKSSLQLSIAGHLAYDGCPSGMQTLVIVSSEGNYYLQKVDERGNVSGLQKIPAPAPDEIVRLPIPTAPQMGQPHLVALVNSQTEPRSMLVATWMDMVPTIAKGYPDMRAAMLKHPVAGTRLANFVFGQAPRYRAANGLSEDTGVEGYDLELSRLALDHEQFFLKSPEVQRVAKDAGIDLPKGPDDNTPTP